MKLAESVPLDKPLSIYIQPCNVCNFLCEFCSYQNDIKRKDFKADIMSLETAQRVIENIRRSFGTVKSITLTSAETLLNPYIAEIVKLCKTVATKVALITNGSLLDKKTCDSLIEVGLDEIKISVNGLSDDDFRKIVRKDIDFNKYVDNIRYFSGKNGCNGKTIVILKIIDYMVSDEKRLALFYKTFYGLGTLRIEHLVPTDDRINYKSFAKDTYDPDMSHSGRKVKLDKIITCPLAFYQLRICENGQAKPCCGAFTTAPTLGNALTEELSSIWRKSLSLQYKMLSGYRNIPGCADCTSIVSSAVTDDDELDSYIEQVARRYAEPISIKK
jgi:sulfatase maturation enzyme AslB (radical SAM superfamily)